MKSQIEALVQLQLLDERTVELKKEIAALPQHVAEIERKLDSHIKQLERDRTSLTANGKQRKQHEDDIKAHEAKISKLRDQMLQAKTNEQYRAFQNEIAYVEAEIRKAEDKILDLMSESEPLDANVKRAESALAEEKKSVEAEKADAAKRTAADKVALDLVLAQRKELAGTVNPQLLSQYERIRKRFNGRAVSDATDGRCGACQMALRPQLFQDLKRGEKVLTCETCGRILYYNPPVSLEHELHQQV